MSTVASPNKLVVHYLQYGMTACLVNGPPSTRQDTFPFVVETNGFIVFDWCGWGERYGRFTHMPSGETLVCQMWMGQADWDRAQLAWMLKYDGEMLVHRCERGPYHETGNLMGSVGEIMERLQRRTYELNPDDHLEREAN